MSVRLIDNRFFSELISSPPGTARRSRYLFVMTGQRSDYVNASAKTTTTSTGSVRNSTNSGSPSSTNSSSARSMSVRITASWTMQKIWMWLTTIDIETIHEANCSITQIGIPSGVCTPAYLCASLVSERVDRVNPGGPPCWIEPRENPHENPDDDGQHDPINCQCEGDSSIISRQYANKQAQRDAE